MTNTLPQTTEHLVLQTRASDIAGWEDEMEVDTYGITPIKPLAEHLLAEYNDSFDGRRPFLRVVLRRTTTAIEESEILP